jgi:heat shock protein HtpX
MALLKRIWLFVLTNIAVIFLFSVIVIFIEKIFGIDIRGAAGTSYVGLLIYAGIFGFLGAFFSLAISRWSAKKAYGIVPITSDDIYKLSPKEKIVYDTVLDIANKNGIKMPEVGIYTAQDPNAFATWATKNSSLVAVSSGLLDTMSEREVEAVVAHEMAHIINGDMVTMTLMQGVMNTFVVFFAHIAARAIDNFTDGKLGWLGYNAVYLVLQIILGIFASMVVMAFSRHREFKADEGSARFVGREKMIAALHALKSLKEIAPKDGGKMAPLQINTQTVGGIKKLFMSHPPLEERVAYLESLPL